MMTLHCSKIDLICFPTTKYFHLHHFLDTNVNKNNVLGQEQLRSQLEAGKTTSDVL